MAEIENRPFCRKCLEEAYDTGLLKQTISEYIAGLDDARKVGEQLYQKRLSCCEACDKRVGITCSICGCFVEVRSVKVNMHCPDPEGGKW